MKFRLNKKEIEYIINMINALLNKQEKDPINFKDTELLNFYILLVYHLKYSDFLHILYNINNLSLFTNNARHISFFKSSFDLLDEIKEKL